MLDNNTYIPDETLFLFLKYFRNDLEICNKYSDSTLLRCYNEETNYKIHDILPSDLQNKDIDILSPKNQKHPLIALNNFLNTFNYQLPTKTESQFEELQNGQNLNAIRFSTIKKSEMRAARTKIKKYLKKFQNDKLKHSKKQFFLYNYQREKIVTQIKKQKLVQKFGEKFEVNLVAPRIGKFLPVHTIATMEQSGELNILELNVSTNEKFVPPEEPNESHSKIITELEYTFSIQLENPKDFAKSNNTHENQSGFQGLNTDKKEIIFNGDKIQIAKRDETNPLKLMKIITQNPHKKWEKDEIRDEWKNKFKETIEIGSSTIYNAMQSIKGDVRREDFFHQTTKYVKINEKYLK